ncbi:hypothetical protein Y1Q_0014626 [Alligator mississippiensis]|uniref:Uncharacterized protein n=1 Tax=Alligator mississippiensis TaxID=8496 RepID=A0A151P0Q1_ALLMI|nr:hypothetical protein Y1Q_0014626 [Alligator mississippiensis]
MPPIGLCSEVCRCCHDLHGNSFFKGASSCPVLEPAVTGAGLGNIQRSMREGEYLYWSQLPSSTGTSYPPLMRPSYPAMLFPVIPYFTCPDMQPSWPQLHPPLHWSQLLNYTGLSYPHLYSSQILC